MPWATPAGKATNEVRQQRRGTCVRHTEWAVNELNRAFFKRLAPAFKEAETDELPSEEGSRQRIADANAARIAAGREPLREEPEGPPELNLYRRARALGNGHHRG
jgi:hypothetical protein